MATKKTEVVGETIPTIDEEEKVTVTLFEDGRDYVGDLVVGVNGDVYQIKRGVPVEVPKSVAEVIYRSQAMDREALNRKRKLKEEYKEKSKGI